MTTTSNSALKPYGAELPASETSGRVMNYVLWTVQVLLTCVFLFAGGMKLVVPIAAMAKQMPILLPGWFIRFIGLAEALGAIGLILPGLLRIRAGLTPLAACGLSVITIGATAYVLLAHGGAGALMPLTVAMLSAFVAYGRRFWIAAD